MVQQPTMGQLRSGAGWGDFGRCCFSHRYCTNMKLWGRRRGQQGGSGSTADSFQGQVSRSGGCMGGRILRPTVRQHTHTHTHTHTSVLLSHDEFKGFARAETWARAGHHICRADGRAHARTALSLTFRPFLGVE